MEFECVFFSSLDFKTKTEEDKTDGAYFFFLSMGTWPVQAKLDFPMWMSEFLANNTKEGSNCFTKFNLSFGAGDYSQHIDTEDL